MNKQFCPYCMAAVEEGKPCSSCGLTALAYQPSPHHLPPGTILMDRYLVGRVLGEGGFGITYIGCDLKLELKVAIKEYFPTDKVTRHAQASLNVTNYMGSAAAGYEEGKSRFLGEARTMARMDKQPEIVSVRDFFECNNTAYIVMEYVAGTTFKDLVAQRGGRIDAQELLPMVEPLFSALSAMHERGLIHRDISPDNLMLEKGALRLLDFGCARESARGTETMTIALKHGFAPIEQYQNKGQGPWTDVYALSATIYYCLTGKIPPQALDRLCEDELILPRRLGVSITQRQEDALLYGMGIRPRRRFQSVEELHAALYCADGAPVPSVKEEEPAILASADEVEKTVPAATKTGQEPQPAESQKKTNTIPRFLRRYRIAVGAGAAALILAVVLTIAFWPKDGTPAVDHTGAGAPGINTPSNSDQSGGEEDTPSGPAYFTSGSQEAFRRLLTDESVTEIHLNCPMLLTGEAVEINKTLYVGPDYGLNTNVPIIIGAGGFVQADAELCFDALVRCVDGGRIYVTSTGCISGQGMLWLESAEDLTIDEGGFADLYGESYTDGVAHHLTFREDTLFANAAHVKTYESYMKAMDDPLVPSIVIDGDIDVLGTYAHVKPVLVSEGVTVAVRADHAAWMTESALLVNRGTIRGPLVTQNGERGGRCAVINYGTIASAMSLNGSGPVINYGDIITGDTLIIGASVVNMGTISHTAGNVEIGGPVFLNHGAVTVSSDGGCMVLFNGCYAMNMGSITVERGTMAVESHLITCGSVDILADGALDGSGIIEQTTIGSSMKIESDSVPFRGLFMHNAGSTVQTAVDMGCVMLPFDWVSAGHAWDRARFQVENAHQLREALDDPECEGIYIDCDLVLEGDWTFNKGVAIAGTLTINDGDLTVSGDGYVIGAPIVVDGTVTIQNGGIWLNRSDLHCQALEILQGGSFFNNAGLQDVEHLVIDGGGLFNCGGLELHNAEVDLRAGNFVSLRYLGFANCVVDIHEGVEFSSFHGDYFFDGETRVVNRGTFNLNGLSWQGQALDAVVTNYGSMELTDGAAVGAEVVNHGRIDVYGAVSVYGSVVNHGTIVNHDGGFYENGGSITGHAPENG